MNEETPTSSLDTEFDWWCEACQRGFASQEVEKLQGRSRCPACRAEVRPSEAVEQVSLAATDELDVNDATRKAVAEAGVEVVGTGRPLQPDDVVIVRGTFANRRQERAAVGRLNKAFKKANPGWRGVLLHLPEGMELRHLPIQMVQSLYEALLARFDPDLFAQRAAAKVSAVESDVAAEEASHLATAEEVHAHLARIKAERERGVAAAVQKSGT